MVNYGSKIKKCRLCPGDSLISQGQEQEIKRLSKKVKNGKIDVELFVITHR